MCRLNNRSFFNLYFRPEEWTSQHDVLLLWKPSHCTHRTKLNDL
jgi:hypothetical protein